MRWLILSIIWIGLSTGCMVQARLPQASLEERVVMFGEALVAKDWSTVYSLHDPEFRAAVNEQDFVSRANLDYRAYIIDEIRVDKETKADVIMRYTMIIMGTELEFTRSEEWGKFSEGWLRVVGKPARFPGVK